MNPFVTLVPGIELQVVGHGASDSKQNCGGAGAGSGHWQQKALGGGGGGSGSQSPESGLHASGPKSSWPPSASHFNRTSVALATKQIGPVPVNGDAGTSQQPVAGVGVGVGVAASVRVGVDVGVGTVHDPPVHFTPAGHTLPHFPQLLSSVAKSVHADGCEGPPKQQSESPAGHTASL